MISYLKAPDFLHHNSLVHSRRAEKAWDTGSARKLWDVDKHTNTHMHKRMHAHTRHHSTTAHTNTHTRSATVGSVSRRTKRGRLPAAPIGRNAMHVPASQGLHGTGVNTAALARQEKVCKEFGGGGISERKQHVSPRELTNKDTHMHTHAHTRTHTHSHSHTRTQIHTHTLSRTDTLPRTLPHAHTHMHSTCTYKHTQFLSL